MLTIQKNLTKVNYNKADKKNRYIVMHWVGAVSTARNNSIYFKNDDRGASAHYFVDDREIVQVVEDKDVAWHCGTTGEYYHSTCRNSNSIGIEMCLDKANHIGEATIRNTAELVKSLMKKYNIPENNVIRHYDVTHKRCPAPYIDAGKWAVLRKTLTGSSEEKKEGAVKEKTNISTDAKLPSKSSTSKPAPIYPLPVRLLKNGSKGNDVKWLQTRLNELKKSKLQVDGIFGPKTKAVVLAFQREKRLVRDAIVGPRTLSQLIK